MTTNPTDPEGPQNPGPDSDPAQAHIPEAPAGGGGFNQTVLIVFGCLIVAVGAFVWMSRSGESAGSSDVPYLNLAFTTTDGSEATLADYQGEPLVINFFASWCPPCRREMPDLQTIHQTGQVRIIGISHDFDETSWRSFVSESGVTFETVFQPDQGIYEQLNAIGMPTTILLDADGSVVDHHTGIITADQLQDKIDAHFG